jgi:hypothetical protein
LRTAQEELARKTGVASEGALLLGVGVVLGAMAATAFGATGIANAQTKLKWAHAYETSEPFHKYSVWAAEEIKKRSNGKYDTRCSRPRAWARKPTSTRA